MNATETIRQKIHAKPDSLWQLEDFANLPTEAAAKALSRLAKDGTLERIAKGIYYRPGTSAFGKTSPNPRRLRELASKQHRLFHAGLAAANLLGFSTQTPSGPHFSTASTSVHRRLLGENATIHTRRPEAWNQLEAEEAAILEMLRDAGKHSELSAAESTQRLLELLGTKRRLENLLKVAATEPPRVQAILGAAGQELGKSERLLAPVRARLNPLSRFEFGKFAALTFAGQWQAKA